MPTRLQCALLGAMLMTGCAAQPREASRSSPWNQQAADDALAAMHKLHHAWDKMDMKLVADSIADDGFLTTFEYTGPGQAVRLATKAELVAWLTKQFDEIKQAGGATAAIPQRKMECRATNDVAFCTEECNILIKRLDGQVELSPHRGTSVLRKGPDGWKFAHWHVSESGETRVVAADSPEVASLLK